MPDIHKISYFEKRLPSQPSGQKFIKHVPYPVFGNYPFLKFTAAAGGDDAVTFTVAPDVPEEMHPKHSGAVLSVVQHQLHGKNLFQITEEIPQFNVFDMAQIKNSIVNFKQCLCA